MKCCNCEKELVIKLMPDYSSDHMWCNNCGEPIYPEEINNIIPDYILTLIKYWGLLWDLYRSDKTGLREEYFKKLHDETGKLIQKEMSKYWDCVFINIE